MRMSGFLLGGLVGVAAANYFMRGGKMSGMMPNLAMSGMGSSVGKAMSSMMTGRSDNQSSASSNAAGKPEAFGKQDARSVGLDKVSDLISKDAYVKAQVHEIMQENHQKDVHTTH